MLKTKPRYSVGTGKRALLQTEEKGPGPGAHDAASSFAGAKYTFSVDARNKARHDGSPGPG